MTSAMLSGSFDLDVQELGRPCNVCTISVRWHTSVKDIKDQLKQYFNVPSNKMSLYHSSSPKSLSNQITLHDLHIEQDGLRHILKVVVNVTSSMAFQLILSKEIEMDSACKDMIRNVRQGLERAQVPAKTDMLDCTGGVYFLKAANGEKHAVFKPNDEEQGMPNNPKGHAGDGREGLRPFFKPGQGYIRETAAYLFDQNNFCQVPATTIVHCEHPSFHYPASVQTGLKLQKFPKIGSLQYFVKANDTFEDISPSRISTFELQKIAILDMRLLNCDRNSSNILAIRKSVSQQSYCNTRGRSDTRSSSMGSYSCDEMMTFPHDADDFDFGCSNKTNYSWGGGDGGGNDQYELIPIDHGYCMPSRLKIDELDWIWFYEPHIARDVDPKIKEYLKSIDIEALIARVEAQVKLPEYNSFLLRLANRVLVSGVDKGLNLFEIAQMIARTDEDRPSPLERIIKNAEENAYKMVETRSNRLNSRGAGNTSGNSLSSFKSSNSLRSPVRFTGGDAAGQSQSNTPLQRPSLQRQRSGTGPCGFSTYARGVQSALNLEALGRGDASPRKVPKPLTAASVYLSNENIRRHEQLSPHVARAFPGSSSPAFFVGETSPYVPQMYAPLLECDGVSFGLGGSSSMYDGEPLRSLHSVDTYSYRAQQQLQKKPSGSTMSPASSSPYLRNGSLIADEPSAALALKETSDDDLNPRRSEPIMIALRDDEPRPSEATSCEAWSHTEGGMSPKSFGDYGSYLSGDYLPPQAIQALSAMALAKAGAVAEINKFTEYSPLTVDTTLSIATDGTWAGIAVNVAQLSSPSTDSEFDRASNSTNYINHREAFSKAIACGAPASAVSVSSPPSLQKPPLERPFPPRATPVHMDETTLAIQSSIPISDNNINSRTSINIIKSSGSSKDKVHGDNSPSSGHSTSEEDADSDSDKMAKRCLKKSQSMPYTAAAEATECRTPKGHASHENLVGAGAGLPRDTSFASVKSLSMVTGLQRVTSFNAFESPAIYEGFAAAEEDSGSGKRAAKNQLEHRQLKMLHSEQRKLVAQTAEFQKLRLDFAQSAVDLLITKEMRRKRGLSVSSEPGMLESRRSSTL